MSKLTQENIDAINRVLADLAEGKTQREIGERLGFPHKDKAQAVSQLIYGLRILGVAVGSLKRGDYLKATVAELQELRRYKAEREAADRASA